MTLSLEDRQQIEALPLCGTMLADCFDRIGVRSLAELADADAYQLRVKIASTCEDVRIDAFAVRGLHNAIAAARRVRNRRDGIPAESHHG
ncbi:MAG: hypothetical protein JNM13_16975 [Hyphomicrobiaceae bacterium]|nr:hypothetical protein [Hyphomicrobiaceae bacterium]